MWKNIMLRKDVVVNFLPKNTSQYLGYMGKVVKFKVYLMVNTSHQHQLPQVQKIS